VEKDNMEEVEENDKDNKYCFSGGRRRRHYVDEGK